MARRRGTGMDRIIDITLDDSGVVHYHQQVEAERATAVSDLLAENHFRLVAAGRLAGPYRVRLSRQEDRLVFDISAQEGATQERVRLALAPLRGLIRDYFTLSESYYEALGGAPGRLEAIDMGRRSLHNEGAECLRDRLAANIDIDLETARRLFTLICVLHIKG